MKPIDDDDPLKVLRREVDPPGLLEARVRRTLRGRGLLRPGRMAPAWRVWARVAAVLILLAAGYWAGRRSGAGDVPSAEGRRYVLLLYEDSAFQTAIPEEQLVAEYSAWAATLSRQGQLDLGEKLADDDLMLPGREDTLGGFFIIRAGDDAEALAIARACPHLKYGGRVALREIVET